MKPSYAILAALLLCCLSVRAQDRTDGIAAKAPVISDTEAAARGLRIQLAEPVLDLPMMRDEADPIRRERLRIRRLMQDRARQSVPSESRAAASPAPLKKTGLWRLNAGNGNGQWSPFPDRALDARTLRFPMPRGIGLDTRPTAQQRLEKLKRK